MIKPSAVVRSGKFSVGADIRVIDFAFLHHALLPSARLSRFFVVS